MGFAAEVPADWRRIDLTDATGWPGGPIRETFRAARARGVVLWAGHRRGSGRPGDPASLLSLTLALLAAPAAAVDTPAGPAALPTHACAFPFADPRLQGILVVGHEHGVVPGVDRPLRSYLVQVFGWARAAGLLAVLSVVTHDPSRYQEAAVVAAQVAGSLRLLPAVPAPASEILGG